MATFVDATGETWTIEITVAEIRQLRRELSLDLLKLLDDNGAILRNLAADPIQLVDVISLLCSDQVTRRSLDEIGFAKRLVGSALEAALDCLIEAIANFSPPRQGAIIRQMWEKSQVMNQRAMDKIQAKLADPKLEAILDEKLDAYLSKPGN